MKISIGCVVCVAVAAGCGNTNRDSGSPCDAGTGTGACAVGSVDGVSISVADTTSFSTMQLPAFNQDPQLAYEVLLLDSAGACTDLSENSYPKDTIYLELGLFQTGSTGAYVPPTTGSYPIVSADGRTGSANFIQYNQWCMPTIGSNGQWVGGEASSGSINVTNVNLADGGTISGTFDVTFTDGGTLAGAFNSPYCGETISAADAGCR